MYMEKDRKLRKNNLGIDPVGFTIYKSESSNLLSTNF